MIYLFDLLSNIRHTDYKKYLEFLDEYESKFIDIGDADSLAFIQALKAAEKGGKIAL